MENSLLKDHEVGGLYIIRHLEGVLYGVSKL